MNVREFREYLLQFDQDASVVICQDWDSGYLYYADAEESDDDNGDGNRRVTLYESKSMIPSHVGPYTRYLKKMGLGY